MNHELFGDINYDNQDQQWTGQVNLRLFAMFGLDRYADDTDPQLRLEGMLPLIVSDSEGTGPSPHQVAAYRFLLEHQADVFHATLGALFESYKEYTASPISGFWDWVGRKLGVKPIESPDELAASATFTELQIGCEHRSGVAYLVFNVDCDWEPEHGMLVVYHKDCPATWTTVDAMSLESD
jgi:uncharacterized protein DUF6985